MSRAPRRRGPSWGGRKRFTLHLGPFSLYQNLSARVSRDGLRGGPTSYGWRLWTPLGPLSHNVTHGRWSWDTWGWGALRWEGRFRDVFTLFRRNR